MNRHERKAQEAMNRHKKNPVPVYGLTQGFVSPRDEVLRMADQPAKAINLKHPRACVVESTQGASQ